MNVSDSHNSAKSFQEGGASDDRVIRIIDEEILIKRFFDDNPRQGCEVLFQKYYKILCSHAVRFVNSKDVAEDLVSEMFCRFWSDKIYLTIQSSYRAYLFKAVRYSAYNYIRWELSKDKKSIDSAALENSVDSQIPEQALLYNELSGEIERVINTLPTKCKKVFLMSRFENKKYSEIAEELGISIKAVEAHISKALEILRSNLTASDLLTVTLIGVISAQ